MREQFITRDDDGYDSIEWLYEVHLKQRDNKKVKSAIITGNEDAPEKVELFLTKMPKYNAKPYKIYVSNDYGDLKLKNPSGSFDGRRRDAMAFYYLSDPSGRKGRSFNKLVTARNAAKKWANEIGKTITVNKYWGPDSETPFEYVEPTRRKNPSRKGGRRSVTKVVGDITGKIVKVAKDSITIFAPKGTTAKLMSNPGTKNKIKNIQMGYLSGTGFHPIRASFDYDEYRLDSPKVANEREQTKFHRIVRQGEQAKIKMQSAKTEATRRKYEKSWNRYKKGLAAAARKAGYSTTPKWARDLLS